MPSTATALPSVLQSKGDTILNRWKSRLKGSGILQSGRLKEADLEAETQRFVELLRGALATAGTDFSSSQYDMLRDALAQISRNRALLGFTPTETATFVFSLKEPLFDALQEQHGTDAKALAGAIWNFSELLDRMGLYTMEVFQRSREEVIVRQQREISELSTPVVKLWTGILALPLIGTLDSERTQVVMESLLQSIVDQSAEIAIIDITGVPTVDTLVAQHLLKTVSAARLMGADCIISGIRPQIAQTMVHLGVELNVVSKATLADAFSLALARTGRTLVAKPTKDSILTARP